LTPRVDRTARRPHRSSTAPLVDRTARRPHRSSTAPPVDRTAPRRCPGRRRRVPSACAGWAEPVKTAGRPPRLAYRGPVPTTTSAPYPRPRVRDVARPRPVGAVSLGGAVALVAAAGVWLTWRVFVRTYTGQRVDQIAFEGARFGQGRLWRVAEPVLDVVSIPSVALVLLAAVLIATVRRRWELAVQVAVLVGGSNLTTQLLKHAVLDRPDHGLSAADDNTLPSGHTTAAASVAAALVFVVPPRARPWAALLGAGYTAATGVSTLVGRWHRPSDVAAAVLVVLAWSALACAVSAVTRPRRARGPGSSARRGRPAAGAGPAVDPRSTAAIGEGGVPARGAARVMAGLLALAGLAAGVPAALALGRLWDLPDGPATTAELLTGYAGGALGVVAVTCVAFAVLLAVRDLCGRAAGRVGGGDPVRRA
jgi:membrane-associated phospholipid phosphatase